MENYTQMVFVEKRQKSINKVQNKEIRQNLKRSRAHLQQCHDTAEAEGNTL